MKINLNFNKHKNDRKFDGLSFSSKFYYLKEFHDKIEKLKDINSASKNVEQKE